MSDEAQTRQDANEITRRNVRTVRELEALAVADPSFADRCASFVAGFCGSIWFVWAHAVLFGGWVAFNSIPGLHHFDPYPFTLLTMWGSLESIFLASFIMIAQNYAMRVSERRAQLELCSLTADRVHTAGKGRYLLHITDAKTKAGVRFVGVSHPAPIAILKRRLKGREGAQQVFPELTPGGLDKKFSASAVKAYGRYRRACGVPDGTDFHSFRRNVITALEAAGVGQVPIARFVGHKVGTLAADTYSAGGSKELALDVAAKLRYAADVEQWAIKVARA